MKLKKPLIVFDLETTGIWVEKDKIVEIAIIKLFPDGHQEKYEKRLNPEMPIPPVVSKLIGITDEDVKDAPKFKDVAAEILKIFEGAEVAGFNVVRFDLPVLERELNDAGLSFNWQTSMVYDAQKVFHINEKRDLTGALKHYCQKDLENAHSAMADTQATLDVLEAQVQKYGEGKEEIEVLSQFEYKRDEEFYDDDRKFRWWNGKLYMMFGKYARKASLQEVVKKDRGYLEWILSAKFSDEVKNLVQAAINGQFPTPNTPVQKEIFR